MIAAMRAVDVTAAVVAGDTLTSSDNDYAFRVAAAHPDAFRYIAALDPEAGDLEDLVVALRAHPAVIGIRIGLLSERQVSMWRAGRYTPLLNAVRRYSLPLCLYPPTLLDEIGPAVRRFADVQFVIDHLGLPQPTSVGDRDEDTFRQLSGLLALASYENVAVKLTGAPTLSDLLFPFDDLWPHLHQVVDAFGPDRVMWGSDWTRMVGRCSYEEAVDYLRDTDELSRSDKSKIMSRTVEQIFNWRPSPTAS